MNKNIFGTRINCFRLLAIVLVSIPFLFFQNCSKMSGFEAKDEVIISSADCFESDADACLFLKSPVSDFGRPIDSSDSRYLDRLSWFQNLAVVLPEPLDALGFGAIEVPVEDRLALLEGHGRRPFHEVPLLFGRVTAYHWAGVVIDLMQQAIGFSYFDNHSLRIVNDEEFEGWSPSTSTIYLGANPEGYFEDALDPTLFLHLLGQAGIYYASEGAIYESSGMDEHADCGDSVSIACCVEKHGCSMAIASGFSDYLIHLSFPGSPAFGETVGNWVEGLPLCSKLRDPRDWVDLSAQEAFLACPEHPGQVNAMGTFMASMLWNIEKRVKKENPDLVLDFWKLYFKLWEPLESEDTFLTLLEKVESLDGILSEGVLSGYWREEFKARGYSIPLAPTASE